MCACVAIPCCQPSVGTSVKADVWSMIRASLRHMVKGGGEGGGGGGGGGEAK